MRADFGRIGPLFCHRHTRMNFNPAIPYNDLPPLPPKVDIETKAVLKKLAQAGRSLAELKGLGATIPNQSILVNSLVLREAKASAEIENIRTTNDALYKAFTSSSSVLFSSGYRLTS